MLTNLTTPHTIMPSNQSLLGTANQAVSSLVHQAKETHKNAIRTNIKPKTQERDLLSTCPKSVSVQCFEGLSPTHLQSPLGAVITGADESYVPNAWGDAISVSQKDLDVVCAGNFNEVQKFVSTKNNNQTVSLEDIRNHYNGGDVFCASEPFEASIVRDSFKNIQPASLVIKDNMISAECPEDTYKTFKASSMPWDIASGFRRTTENEGHRNLKKRTKSKSSSEENSGSNGNGCTLPNAQCPEQLIPTHKRIIPGTVVVNALGKNLDVYYVPNTLGQTIQVNENDAGVSCARDWSELKQDYNNTHGFMPTFEQVRQDMGGGEIYCTNKVPDDKVYPNAFVVKSHASYGIDDTYHGNNIDTITTKCPEGTNPVFMTNPTPTIFGEADIGNKIKIIAGGVVGVLAFGTAVVGACLAANNKRS